MPAEPVQTAPATPTPTPTAPAQQTLPLGNPEPEIKLTHSQYQALVNAQTELIREREARIQHERDQAAKEAEMKVQAGQLQEGLAALRAQSEQKDAEWKQKMASTEETVRRFAVDTELSKALAEQPIVPGSLGELASILRPHLNAVPENGTIAVRTPTMQTAAQLVQEYLSKPHASHWIKAQNQGGTGGATGAHHAAPTGGEPPPPIVPQNLGQAAILDTLAAIKERQSQPNVPAALDMSVPFGIVRKKA